MPINSSKTTWISGVDLRRSLLLFASVASLVWAKPSVMAADMSQKSLFCGRTRFVLTNVYDPAAFIASQVLVSRRGEDPVFQVDLRIRRHGDGAGPFGFVSDWLCHRGHRGVFLELLYGCNSYMTKTASDRYCGGDETAQWGRYIGLDGQPLDRGYRIGDPRYRELDRRLGLSDPRTEPMLQAD